MCDSFKNKSKYVSPQCQHFVLRKKRLCRMTVKPGKQYCGEHEPQPKTDDGQDDNRVPCPNDPKHTCYVSKLDKHLSICNARQVEQPDYIIQNINAPMITEQKPRLSLSEIPVEKILNVIEKINILFESNLKDKIEALPERPIHSAVLQEFNESGRTESSLRHLRQASSLLHVMEDEGLVTPETCFVELGAGKGQLSYYAWRAWGQRWAARVLLVDRAALRHKRDNRLRELPQHQRLRADLAHLALERVPAARDCTALVGYAKHLCGVATDYALRCVAGRAAGRARGMVLATCCHHRCERAAYPAVRRLLELGIDEDDFNVMLGLVSWATSGDGRSRHLRHGGSAGTPPATADPELVKGLHDGGTASNSRTSETHTLTNDRMASNDGGGEIKEDSVRIKERSRITNESTTPDTNCEELCATDNCTRDSMQNIINIHKIDTNDEIHESRGTNNETRGTNNETTETNDETRGRNNETRGTNNETRGTNNETTETNDETRGRNNETRGTNNETRGTNNETRETNNETKWTNDKTIDEIKGTNDEPALEVGTKNLKLSKEQREEIGKRAKALLDWGRVLYLQECGFDARLVYYVPLSVSLENVCIVATKRSDAV